MEIPKTELKPPPPSGVVITGRKKPKPKRMSQQLTSFMNQLTTESYGKLLQSTGESPSTDKVDLAGDLVITFIDIGQGNCTFIECPGGETILVDCGSVTPEESGKWEIAALASSYIKSRLTKATLDYLIISHPDKDHMNLLHKVLEGVTVKKLLCGGSNTKDYGGKGKDDGKGYLESQAPDNDLERALINGGAFYMEKPSTEEKDRLIQCKHGLDVFVVCANADKIDTSVFKEKLHVSGVEKLVSGTVANTCCVVLCFRYKGRQVLICGDATFSSEYVMLASDWGKHLKSDALEGGHHGSADSFSDEFLQVVNPSWIHFSADNRGKFRHPTWETVDRVLRCCPNVKGSSEYGPHGIVMGPKRAVGLEQQKKKQEFIEKTPRVAAVLKVMLEKKVAGKAALQALLPVWFKEGEWRKEDPLPPAPIKEEWVVHLLADCTSVRSMETELVAYWGEKFDQLAAEELRIAALTDWDQETYYWDWAAFDFNLFTTLFTANLGVYWIYTVTKEGDVFTDLA